MDPFKNVTAEEYGTWLVQNIEQCTDPEIKAELRCHYEDLVADLSYLERCLSIEPYATDRSL